MTINVSGDVNKSINGSLLIGIGLIVLGIVAIAVLEPRGAESFHK